MPVRFCRQSQTPDSGEPDDAVGISGIEIRKMRFAHKSDGGPLDSIGGAGRDGLASSLKARGVDVEGVRAAQAPSSGWLETTVQANRRSPAAFAA